MNKKKWDKLEEEYHDEMYEEYENSLEAQEYLSDQLKFIKENS